MNWLSKSCHFCYLRLSTKCWHWWWWLVRAAFDADPRYGIPGNLDECENRVKIVCDTLRVVISTFQNSLTFLLGSLGRSPFSVSRFGPMEFFMVF